MILYVFLLLRCVSSCQHGQSLHTTREGLDDGVLQRFVGVQKLTLARNSIIADAAVRRFQCQRAYLRSHAGLRWMNNRSSILRGQKPNASHLSALQQADTTLRNVRWFTPFANPPPTPLVLAHMVQVHFQAHWTNRSGNRNSSPSQTPMSKTRSALKMLPSASG